MKHILLHGNCQLGGVFAILKLNPNKYTYEHIICHKTDISKEQFIHKIKNADAIITQHISNGYRGKDYLGTNFILSHADISTKIVIVDTCYFKTYFYDYVPSPLWASSVSAYSYKSMLTYIYNGKHIDEYINDILLNPQHTTLSFLNNFLENDFNQYEMRHRLVNKNFSREVYQNLEFIHISDFIKNNFKDKLLFYSVNHPSKHVLQYIASEIISLLDIDATINYHCDPLAAEKCIIFSSVKSLVNFDLPTPYIRDKTQGIYEICKRYWDAYHIYN
jgi:hypothetical protein